MCMCNSAITHCSFYFSMWFQEELLLIKSGSLAPKNKKPKKQSEVVKREAFEKYLKIFYNRFEIY